MKSWDWTTIGDSCELTSGGTPSKNNPHFWIGDLPFISARDLKSDRIEDGLLHIASDAVEKSSAKIAPVGSLLMLVRGMGLANGIQIGEVTSPVAFNQDIRAIHPPSTIIPRFLLLALRSSFLNGEGERVLSSAAHGTLKIDTDALRQIAIPVPPIPEQRRIVGILDEAFAGIATAKANAEKNLRNARALFESHLQGLFNHQSIGLADRKFGDRTLLEIIDGDRGSNYPKADDFSDEGHCLFLNTKNVRPDGFSFESRMFITAAKDAELRKGKLKRDDVLLTTRGTVGNIAHYSHDVPFDHIRINSGMLVLRPDKNTLLPAYLFELLRSDIVKNQIRAQTTGAAQPQLPIKTLVNFVLPVPTSLHDHRGIVDKLRAVEPETRRLESLYEQKVAALDALKKSLLHQAFAGKL